MFGQTLVSRDTEDHAIWICWLCMINIGYLKMALWLYQVFGKKVSGKKENDVYQNLNAILFDIFCIKFVVLYHRAKKLLCLLPGYCCKSEGWLWVYTVCRAGCPYVLPLQWDTRHQCEDWTPGWGGVYCNAGIFFHYSEILETSVKTELQDEVVFTVMQVCSSTTVRY